MKKNIIILICCIILGGFTGTYIWFQVQKYNVKNKVSEFIRSEIKKEDLVLLKFTKAESETKLRWEHAKEFEYNEQMYDIVEIEYHNDSIYYWCWHDKEETRINNQIKNIAKFILPNNIKDKNNNNNQRNILKNLYCEVSFNKSIHLNAVNLNHKEYHIYYSSLFYTPLTPPPR